MLYKKICAFTYSTYIPIAIIFFVCLCKKKKNWKNPAVDVYGSSGSFSRLPLPLCKRLDRNAFLKYQAPIIGWIPASEIIHSSSLTCCGLNYLPPRDCPVVLKLISVYSSECVVLPIILYYVRRWIGYSSVFACLLCHLCWNVNYMFPLLVSPVKKK